MSLLPAPLPCDNFPSANIIPRPTAHAHDDPILVLQAEFRVERSARKRKTGDFQAEHSLFTANNYGAVRPDQVRRFPRDMVSGSAEDGGPAPRLLLTVVRLCAAVN